MPSISTIGRLEECQPVFQAYITVNRFKEGDTWKTWEYMAWARKMITEYRKENGLNTNQKVDTEDYVEWIIKNY